jgi:hypothetical protein
VEKHFHNFRNTLSSVSSDHRKILLVRGFFTRPSGAQVVSFQ